jgi:hypothetical protein
VGQAIRLPTAEGRRIACPTKAHRIRDHIYEGVH